MQAESPVMPDVTQRKTITFTMRMDPRVKEAAEEAAAADRRSLSALIEILLVAYCEERGFLEPRLPRKRTNR